MLDIGPYSDISNLNGRAGSLKVTVLRNETRRIQTTILSHLLWKLGSFDGRGDGFVQGKELFNGGLTITHKYERHTFPAP